MVYCLLHNSPGFVLRVSENSCCYAQQQGQQNSRNLRRSRYSILQHVENNCFHHRGCSLLCSAKTFFFPLWSFMLHSVLFYFGLIFCCGSSCGPVVVSPLPYRELTARLPDGPQTSRFLSKSKYMMCDGCSPCRVGNVKQSICHI